MTNHGIFVIAAGVFALIVSQVDSDPVFRAIGVGVFFACIAVVIVAEIL